MTLAPNTKLILTGAALLVAIVGCSVGVARAITNDRLSPEPDGDLLTSAMIVNRIRLTMNDTPSVNVPIQAYIIPSADAHQSEFPAPQHKRVQYVSGFTGSSAMIVIEVEKASLWTDSRYFDQAEKQLDSSTWTLMKSGMPSVPTLEEYLVASLTANSRVGIDPYLIEAKEFQRIYEYLDAAGIKLVSLQTNLVDSVWKNRPTPKLLDLEPIDYRYSGKRIYQKLDDVRKALKELNAEMMVVTALEDVAWLLNLRGSDFEYAPLFFGYIIITDSGTFLYLLGYERGETNTVFNHFQTEHVDVKVEEYTNILAAISTTILNKPGKVLLSKSVSEAIQSVVPADRRVVAESPIMKMRIIKNDEEAKGMHEAHKRDGAAVIKYLYFLETEVDDQNITEIKGAEKLKFFKKTHEFYRRLSFKAMSAVGAHASIAHYTPTLESDVQITREELYLIEAGTQYMDGTTDITRTIHLGQPTDQEKDAFTRVLKGFISVATAVFPPNAPFSFFDAMARRALWEVGLDYNHATGHGVGAYLNVHEYPPLISSSNMSPGMCKNMFTTNEPGYYEEDKFGIRIENVLQVVDVPDSSQMFGGRGAFKFEDITMVPIQTKMINVDLLTEPEIEWFNQYHMNVRKNVSPLLSDNSNILEWLERETQPISKKKQDCNQTPPEHNEKDTSKAPAEE